MNDDLALHPGMHGANEVENASGGCAHFRGDALVRARLLNRDAVARGVETGLTLVDDPVDDRVVLIGSCRGVLQVRRPIALAGLTVLDLRASPRQIALLDDCERVRLHRVRIAELERQ